MVSSSISDVSASDIDHDRRESNLSATSFESDPIAINDQYTFAEKMTTGIRWIIDPVRRPACKRSNENSKTPLSPPPLNLKPQLNRVNGLLKYFTFGVMFTNGILGFLLFIIGLWSSFEHRKISSMPNVDAENPTSLNPFKFLSVIMCIFGLLFFLLAIVSCMGINRENLNLLRISLIGQFVAFITFLIVAIIIIIWNDKIRQRIVEGMMTGLKSYYHIDEAWASFFDKLHLSYFCCGVYSFDDWNSNPHYTCTVTNQKQSFDACAVPFTCCKAQSQQRSLSGLPVYKCGANILPADNATLDMEDIHQRIHVNGCFDEILPIIQQLIITAAVFMLLICIIIVITIFLTCFISFEIRLTVANVKRYYRKHPQMIPTETSTEKEETDRF